MSEETSFAADPTSIASLIAETTVAFDAYQGNMSLVSQSEREDFDAVNEFIVKRLYRLEDVGVSLNHASAFTPDPSLVHTDTELVVLREFAAAVQEFRSVVELVDDCWDDKIRRRQPDLKEHVRRRLQEAHVRVVQAAKNHRSPARPYGFHRRRWDELDALRAAANS